jgi:hypothetical protein
MILIEIPLAGIAGWKNGLSAGKMDLTNSQFDKQFIVK